MRISFGKTGMAGKISRMRGGELRPSRTEERNLRQRVNISSKAFGSSMAETPQVICNTRNHNTVCSIKGMVVKSGEILAIARDRAWNESLL